MLAIVIVNYKNESKTVDFVKNQLSKIRKDHIIVIVNNCADDVSNTFLADSLQAELIYDFNNQLINLDKKCFVISSLDNLGFARGNNHGCSFVDSHFDVEYILLSNNDIVFLSDNVVERLVDKLSEMPNIAMIGPEVIGLEGERQSPEPFYPFIQRYILRYWWKPFLSKRVANRLMKTNYSQEAKEGIHYKIMGSFLLLRKSDFVNCGMMDSNTFLYGEEVILAERLRKLKKDVYYYPSVTVLHEHSATISKYIQEERKRKIQFESEAYYYKNYKGVNSLLIGIGRGSLLLYNFFRRIKRKLS